MRHAIYKIINTINNKFYVGSSININERKREHFKDLENGCHHNILLQRSYIKYGKSAFSFEIIEYVELKPLLIEREQHYIDTLNPEYNICKTAGSSLGRKLSPEHVEKLKKANLGLKRTEWHRMKISEAQRGKKKSPETIEKMRKINEGKHKLEKNVMWGKHHSDQAKEKISKRALDRYKDIRNVRAKLSDSDILFIREIYNDNLLDFGYKSLANMFDVSFCCIRDIVKVKTYKNVKEEV